MAEEQKKPAEIPQELRAESSPLPKSCDGLFGGNTSGSKTTWPELVGKTGEEAEKKIKEERPGVDVQIIPEDSFVTMDFRTNRVRIFVDSSGNVARAPKIG